jgi:hypothetical protein
VGPRAGGSRLCTIILILENYPQARGIHNRSPKPSDRRRVLGCWARTDAVAGARWRCGARGAGAWRVVLVLGARRAWPAAAGGGAPVRCPHPGRGVGSATVAPAGPATRELRGRDRRPARRGPGRGARDDRMRGARFRRDAGSDRTVCLTISPALALESTQFLYSTPANSSPEKARARSQECTSKRTHLPPRVCCRMVWKVR